MRKVFYSFHYAADAWRASQVRNIGVVDGSRPATDNDWEQVKRGGDAAIKRWASAQMQYRSCTVVLVGSNTASRKWVKYEIAESWNKGMGVCGIYINGLKAPGAGTSLRGRNPFELLRLRDKTRLSSVVQCHEPEGHDSQSKYNWIKRNLEEIIEDAIQIRKNCASSNTVILPAGLRF